MSKNRKVLNKKAAPEIPIVLDPCGVNVLDPNGVHVVNFQFEINAKDESETSRFDGDIDVSLPHNIGKNQKLPKIDVTHPSLTWKTNFAVQIDDNFINLIKEKKMIYRFTFTTRIPGHKTPIRQPAKRGQVEKSVIVPTLFFDASCLLVRGGRFKPFLSCATNCTVPGFSEFKISLTLDHPLLSDAQIRKFQPTACYVKWLHQMPEKPLSFSELKANNFVPPYLTFRSESLFFTSVPAKFASDIKIGSALIFWASNDQKIDIELHDRESKIPESAVYIGSGFISPEVKQQEPAEISPLSIEQILDIKKDNVQQPFGKTSIELKPGRYLGCFQPVIPRDCTVQAPFYVEAGTYITCEIENLVAFLPPLPQQPQSPTASKRSVPEKHPPKKDAHPSKQILFHRTAVITTEMESNAFLADLQTQIVNLNAKTFKQKDTSVVATLKIGAINSPAISGIIVLVPPSSQICILETVDESENDVLLADFFKENPNPSVYTDYTRRFSERLYWEFDCAVKKFKLKQPIVELLKDPEIYLQNSPLSSCFAVLNNINTMFTIHSLMEIVQNNLWPKKTDMEMVSAKKGSLLSFEELSFPPLTPEIIRIRSMRFLPKMIENTPQDIPHFKYIPINQDIIDDPPHDMKYYEKRNFDYIKDLDKKYPKERGRIQVSEDGETEIWEATASQSVSDEWEVQNPEDFKPLATEASTAGFLSRLREVKGTEVKDGSPFYSYRTPKSALSKREELMVDVNVEPWLNGDLSLANSDQRWLTATRGAILSEFRNVCPEKDMFNEVIYQSQEDKYRPKTTIEKRDYVTRPMNHKKRFFGVISPVNKNESIRKDQKEVPPLTLEEPYTEKRNEVTPRLDTKKPRFNTLYKPGVRKGGTDSLRVRKISENLPKIEIMNT